MPSFHSIKQMIHSSTLFNVCWSTIVEHWCNLLTKTKTIGWSHSTSNYLTKHHMIQCSTYIILLNSSCNICCSTNVESSLALHNIVAVIYQEDVMSVQIHSFQIGKLVGLLLNKYCYQCIILIFILIFNIIILINNLALLPVYGCVWQGLVTTKFTNLIGWNWNKPRSRFSYLDWHQDWIQFALKLETKIKKNVHCFLLFSYEISYGSDKKVKMTIKFQQV